MACLDVDEVPKLLQALDGVAAKTVKESHYIDPPGAQTQCVHRWRIAVFGAMRGGGAQIHMAAGQFEGLTWVPLCSGGGYSVDVLPM